MALTAGTRLGAYEVTVQIGEGGMGQVWRARDTKLNRDVALKVLPDSLADDADRLARFRREAQVLASLNHPNIAAIYGLEESPAEAGRHIVTPVTADPISIALAPDGRQIAFVALGDGISRLWLRRLGATIAEPLAGTEGAALPFWSPDSRSLGFFAGGELKRLDIGGGAPQTLATVGNPRGGTWNAEGTILFPPTTGGPVFRVPATGGQATAVTKLDRQSSHRFPSFLPDGRHFLFLAQGAADAAGIYLGALDSADTRRLRIGMALVGPGRNACVHHECSWRPPSVSGRARSRRTGAGSPQMARAASGKSRRPAVFFRDGAPTAKNTITSTPRPG